MCNDPNHVPSPQPNWWDRNKGKVLGTVAIAASVIAASQIYARHNDHKWMKEQGLYGDYMNHLTPIE